MPPKSMPHNWPIGSSSLSNRAHPAIDDQIGASDKSALVRCEEERGIGNFFGPAHPTERDHRDEVGANPIRKFARFDPSAPARVALR